MDFVQLEHFLAVVEERTFTRAAERVCRTQPAVSQSIKKLEDECSMPLLVRDPHEICLTEAGRVLAGYARRMVHLRDEAMRHVADIKTLKTGMLSIAAHESAAVYLLPAPLREYLQRSPGIKVSIYRSCLHEIPRQVLDREVDIGFVKDEPEFHELTWTNVYTDQMVLIASRQHPLSALSNVTVEDLGSHPFVLHHACNSTTEMISRIFKRHRTRLRVVAELWSFENIKSFVREDVGLAIVPGVTVRDELRDGTFIRIRVPELEISRRTLMICREQGDLSDWAGGLFKLIQSFEWDAIARQPARPQYRIIQHASASASGGARLSTSDMAGQR